MIFHPSDPFPSSRPPAPEHQRGRSALLARAACGLTLAVVCAGCSDSEPREPTFETIDVGEGIDHAIDVDTDLKAAARVESFRGVMPGDFPRDVWVYQPGAVIDFGTTEGGRGFVVLRALEPAGPVARNLTREMRSRGWSGEQGISGAATWRRDGREVLTSLKAEGSETLLRIEY